MSGVLSEAGNNECSGRTMEPGYTARICLPHALSAVILLCHTRDALPCLVHPRYHNPRRLPDMTNPLGLLELVMSQKVLLLSSITLADLDQAKVTFGCCNKVNTSRHCTYSFTVRQYFMNLSGSFIFLKYQKDFSHIYHNARLII